MYFLAPRATNNEETRARIRERPSFHAVTGNRLAFVLNSRPD